MSMLSVKMGSVLFFKRVFRLTPSLWEIWFAHFRFMKFRFCYTTLKDKTSNDKWRINIYENVVNAATFRRNASYMVKQIMRKSGTINGTDDN